LKSQELYQVFQSQFDGHQSQRQIDQWWTWIRDEIQEDEESMINKDWIIDMVERLKDNEPIQYLTQKAYFYDLQLFVNSAVLIPRPETEELVDLILRNEKMTPQSVLDIGTGSGAIALMLKKKWPKARVQACDISQDSLDVAQTNAEKLNLPLDLFIGNFYDEFPLTPSSLDVLVSNPPYISRSEKVLMTDNTSFEPEEALFAVEDRVVEVYEAIAKWGTMGLKSGGKMYLELNEFFAEQIADMILKYPFESVEVVDDMQGKKRILIATRK